MKAVAAFSALAGLTLADMQTMTENLQKMVENATDPKLDRGFGSAWAQSYLENINQYGCWCYFQDDHGKGRGIPANEVDTACKVLHDGYSCILMDFETDANCIPWDIEYVSGNGLGLAASDPDNASVESAIRKSCSRSNRGGRRRCQASSCMVESLFVLEMFRMFLEGVTFDKTLKHSEGFVPKEGCKKKTSGAVDENGNPITPNPNNGGDDGAGNALSDDKSCCGEYPRRYPYKLETNAGSKGCCGAATYNIDYMACCKGNEIKVSC